MTQGASPTIVAEDLWQKEWRREQHTEPITKLLQLQTSFNGSNKLFSISKDASIKVYRGQDFHLLQTLNYKPTSSTIPVWPSDAEIITLNGHKKLVVSSYDRSLAFYNVLLAEFDPERPDEQSCLGLGGVLNIPAPGHAATALGSLLLNIGSYSSNKDFQDQKLVFGDETGKVTLLKRTTPTMGLSAKLEMKDDTEQLHSHHTASISQLLHIPHVGLLSSSLDGTIGIFDPEKGRIAATTGHLHSGSAVRCMAYHQPLTLAVSGGAGRSALLWHPRGDPGKAVGELPGQVSGVLSICTGAGGGSTEHAVVTLSGTGAVTIFDLRTLRPLQKLESTGDYPSHEDARPTALTFDQGRQRVVTATKRPCAWSFSSGGGDITGARIGGSQSLSSPATVAAKNKSTGTATGTIMGVGVGGASAPEKENGKGESASLLLDNDDADVGRDKEDEVSTWRQAHSRLRLATIPETAAAWQVAKKG
ncbi:hypothetical protein Ndes2526B_g00107 [Nannochloris sp. 'desiccata']|nr:hypothetical protein NADE_001964 [Chlorella desiccata (nom. nud.)]